MVLRYCALSLSSRKLKLSVPLPNEPHDLANGAAMALETRR